MTVASAQIQMQRLGTGGPPVLFLHGMDGLLFCQPFLQELARSWQVLSPEHPGWGSSPRTPQFRTLDDISYAYLDLLEEFDTPIPVIGVSLGAWLAAEIATKSCEQISSLVLVSPVGVRVGERTERSFLDLYASPAEVVTTALYGDPAKAPVRASLTDEQFEGLARAQEATAYYGWEPYMYNPCLPDRLHRLKAPTLLVSGERDGFVLRKDVFDAFATGIPNVTDVVRIPGVGHRVEEEAPLALAELITGFLRQSSAAARSQYTEGER